LDILFASKFHGLIEKGGSTKPWKVDLRSFDGKEETYIVKPFTRKVNQTQFATAKEFYGNTLAYQFDLPVPNCALADFGQDFVRLGLGKTDQKLLAEKDPGLKFASRCIEGAPIFSPLLHKNVLKDYDLARVFAFDCLSFNIDRGGFRNKPNLLIDDEGFFLIDHELTFPFIDNSPNFYNKILTDFGNGTSMYQAQKHLFYPYLNAQRHKAKTESFGEFEEYLSKLNINPLIAVAKQLESLNIPTGDWHYMIDYLSTLKKQPAKFTNILVGLIS
jgi:hypothetical protein